MPWRQAEGGFLLYIFDTLEQENYWVRLEAVPAGELPEKTELVLGIAGRVWEGESLLSRIDQSKSMERTALRTFSWSS